jgi:hypothetical protein
VPVDVRLITIDPTPTAVVAASGQVSVDVYWSVLAAG